MSPFLPDPEIPVNIVDLGLIYACDVVRLKGASHRIDVKLGLTAPGCAMSNVICDTVEYNLLSLPDVDDVRIEIVLCGGLPPVPQTITAPVEPWRIHTDRGTLYRG